MNPWTALLQPIRSRPGERVQPPKAPIPRAVPVAAAALVVTPTADPERPDVRLLPIIIYDFGL
jgi:hypothetical protein